MEALKKFLENYELTIAIGIMNGILKRMLPRPLYFLLACGLLAVCSCQAAFDSFLVFGTAGNVGAVTGESQDAFFHTLGAVQISEFGFSAENLINQINSPGGAAGKAKFNVLTIKKTVDATSPKLFTTLSKGLHFDTVTLYIRKAGAAVPNSPNSYLVFTFRTVFVTSINWSGANADNIPTESVTFECGAMQIGYSIQKPDGSLAPPSTGAWNVVNNSTNLDVAISN